MGYELRNDRGGNPYWSFLIPDPESECGRRRLKKEEVPEWIKTAREAEEFYKAKCAEADCVQTRIKRKLEWRNKHYDFDRLLKIYQTERRKNAKRSWRNDIYWLETYAFPFFLSRKGGGNINNWQDHFRDFRLHLEQVEPIKKGKSKGKRLAYNSMNKVIKALNTFLTCMHDNKLCEQMPKVRCFERKFLTKITIEDIYRWEKNEETEDEAKKNSEIDRVRAALQTISEESADFFWYLIESGQRLSEGLGASMEHLKKGEPGSKEMVRWLKEYNLPCFGYIYLEYQLGRDDEDENEEVSDRSPFLAERDSQGNICKIPLKHRENVSPDNARFIPIGDKELFNMLVKRYKIVEEAFKKRMYGDDKRNYLLFPNMNKNTFSSHLRRACEKVGRPYRSPHKLRHTYATKTCAKIGGHNKMVELVLGHTDSKVTEGYIHLNDQIMSEIKRHKDSQDIDFID
jgi:hypothetical protein